MSYSAIVYKVMIASPGDVASERNIIREVLSVWNAINSEVNNCVLLPVGWETHSSPEMGDKPQSILNKQILHDCDLLIGVFWTRAGTPTDEYPSGSIEEIEEHIKLGKPAMLYFSLAPVVPDSIDQEQYNELKRFKNSCQSRGLYETYANLNDFREKFSRHLSIKINQHDYFKKKHTINDDQITTAEVNLPKIPSLSREAVTILKEASQDQHGYILHLQVIGGEFIKTNGKDLIGDQGPRTIATWTGALNELEGLELVVTKDPKRNVFQLTRKGYELADMVSQ
ncbi:MAG: hypothetical protein K9M17_04110 [Mariprofundaceae bacterium]|nr:hypothetical protein [Mariprofundaceae bacterium]